MDITQPQTEKAIAIAIGRKGADREIAFEHLNELEELANTAGADIIEKFYQELDHPNPATAIGKGKIEEVKLSILERHTESFQKSFRFFILPGCCNKRYVHASCSVNLIEIYFRENNLLFYTQSIIPVSIE